MNYVSAKEAKAFLHINPTTLKAYKDQGLIKYKQLSSRKFLYDIDSFNVKDSEYINRKHVIYARVSNTKQKNDLDNQIEMIKNYLMRRYTKQQWKLQHNEEIKGEVITKEELQEARLHPIQIIGESAHLFN